MVVGQPVELDSGIGAYGSRAWVAGCCCGRAHHLDRALLAQDLSALFWLLLRIVTPWTLSAEFVGRFRRCRDRLLDCEVAQVPGLQVLLLERLLFEFAVDDPGRVDELAGGLGLLRS